MSSGLAEREAESARYRLELMLVEIRTEARADRAGPAEQRADALLQRLRAIQVESNEEKTRAARDQIDALRSEVLVLANERGLRFSFDEPIPQWMRLLRYGGPALGALAFLLFVFERRRKKAKITAESLRQLDEADT